MMPGDHLEFWANLRHGGLLLDLQRLSNLLPQMPESLPEWTQDRLRREIIGFQHAPRDKRNAFVSFVLEKICGFNDRNGVWHRGTHIAPEWTRTGLTGERIRPNQLWLGENDTVIPVFIDPEKRLGIGRGKRRLSQCLQWMRQGKEQLALLSNGQQWRIVFAGLDYDAWCEWELDQWLAEGRLSPEFEAFRALLDPALWRAPEPGRPSALLQAIQDSRKGQTDLSKILGERVRQAAERLIEGHALVLNQRQHDFAPQDIYRAAVRIIMRMVVVLFAESREQLLPHDNAVYHNSYSLQGLRDMLDRSSRHQFVESHSAWVRILALFRLIYQGSSHEAMPVTQYGGELFAPGNAEDADGMKRALHLFEQACLKHDVMNDGLVHQMLELLTRTQVSIRQGRATTRTTVPIDFSNLGNEYIGILYEGLLDYELRSAVEDEPIVFLAVGEQPALPLSTLEAMDERQIRHLFEQLRDTSSEEADEGEAAAPEPEEESTETESDEATPEEDEESGEVGEARDNDPHYTLQNRAEAWARQAVLAANLVRRPRGRMTPEREMQYNQQINQRARQLITKVVLPGEWYLVRWGGTRKGSGTFYTLPPLAVPTVHRTLRPLAYVPPCDADGNPDLDAPANQWTPRKPEDIFEIQVCDPACGSGSFLLAALRYLTQALYDALLYHQRIEARGQEASALKLILDASGKECITQENLPCRMDDEHFEARTKALLRRYVVERCIYGVDLDPLAVELCRLSLWIETLDPQLPLTFLNHKVKCGNSLVGAWFDQFLHYPAMAWLREGGDKTHNNGQHFRREAWTKAIKQQLPEVKSELIRLIEGDLWHSANLDWVQHAHDDAVAALRIIHELPIHEAAQRAEQYFAPFRFYAPETMRWNMRDPLGYIDSPNLYAYVGGNPVMRIDMLGLSWLTAIGNFFASVWGGVCSVFKETPTNTYMDDAVAVTNQYNDAYSSVKYVTLPYEVIEIWNNLHTEVLDSQTRWQSDDSYELAGELQHYYRGFSGSSGRVKRNAKRIHDHGMSHMPTATPNVCR